MKRTALVLTLALLSGCSDESSGHLQGMPGKVGEAIFASAKRALEGMPVEVVSLNHVFKDDDGKDMFLASLKVREVGFPPRSNDYTLVIKRMCAHPTEQCWRIEQILGDTVGDKVVTVHQAPKEGETQTSFSGG